MVAVLLIACAAVLCCAVLLDVLLDVM